MAMSGLRSGVADHWVQPTPEGEALVARVPWHEVGRMIVRVWNPSPSIEHRSEPYAVPKALRMGAYETEESASKFSPPPFALVLEDDTGRQILASVHADAGWHLWNAVEFRVSMDQLDVAIDLERHGDPAEAADHVRLDLFVGDPGESRHDLLRRGLMAQYPDAAHSPAALPAWWLRPSYCGWGDQVAFANWLEGPGPERRANPYCTQGLYRRWVDHLEKVGVPIGTTIIDAGWSPAGVWEPDQERWPDLKGFIAQEHERGRKVLLWLATWLWDGLADEQCVFANGRKLTADPTHPGYLGEAQRRVAHLLSPEGLNADGFKIDQLAFVPNQRRPRGGPRFGWTAYGDEPADVIKLHGQSWGVELLHGYQKAIYVAAKNAKPDCLINSSTVHPYFHDTFDMVRLHDTGVVNRDVIEAMKIRSDLARAAVPGKPIDADDWVLWNYDNWMRYTMNSPKLGVPCIFYSERFLLSMETQPTTKPIPVEDLRRIAEAWQVTNGHQAVR